MKSWLISIAVGPVQEFIAAARRTRDFWFGSYLLSEISKAAAKSIADSCGTDSLIFPAPKTFDDPDSLKEASVGNVIVANLPNDKEPVQIAGIARQAAEERWKEFAQSAFEQAEKYIEENIWKSQLDDVIEFYAAWVPLEDETSYTASRRRLMQIVAGRKSCRDFIQDESSTRRPKSSLDGARDSVLKELGGKERKDRRVDIWLAKGEQLDVVGLTKRIGGGKKSYPSTCRVAADPWIRAAQRCKSGALELGRLKGICMTNSENLGLVKLDDNRWPKYASFPFDTTLLFPTRYNDYYRETGIRLSDNRKLVDSVEKLRKILNGKEPNPYLAILMADGDNMGKTISRLASPKEHQGFSNILSEFAQKARQIVMEAYGCLVYSGGDDVLAMVPLDTCLICARNLYDSFHDLMEGCETATGQVPTLSVGISIGHFIEPLEDLFQWGRLAERDAKTPNRNGLAIHWHSRSGSSVEIRGRWDALFYERMIYWVESFDKGIIPSQVIYQLRDIAAEYKGWPKDEATQKAIGFDVLRLLRKKKSPKGEAEVKWEEMAHSIRGAVDSGGNMESGQGNYFPGVLQLSNEWWIASQLARARAFECRQDEGSLEKK